MTRMVRAALKDLGGIVSFEVDIATAVAVVVFDENLVSYDRIQRVFQEAGFKARRKD